MNININEIDFDNILHSVFDDIDQMMAKELKQNTNSPYIIKFEPENKDKIQLKDFVYMSKDCTYRLAKYIVKENWGKDNLLLYKYLDYIFRCQIFAKQAVIVKNSDINGDECLIFNTGLQRRFDRRILYIILTPNNISNAQNWRVTFGGIEHSFVSQTELIQKLKESNIKTLDSNYLPKRTKFCQSLSDLVYDDTFAVDVNWEERLTTNSDRIYKVIGTAAFFDKKNKFLRLTELVCAFTDALNKTRKIAESNARLAVPQGFVDTKHSKYRCELLLPLIVRFPKRNGKCYKFALAINKSNEKRQTYVAKSILTLDMGYANARLVGYVDSFWLCYGNQRCIDINNCLT